MPVRETDRRKQELQELEDQLARLVEALRDQDWIERLVANADFKKYLSRIKDAEKITVLHREKIVEELSNVLPTRVEREGRVVNLTREELNEQLLVVSATMSATAEVTGWPMAQEKRLADARREIPKFEESIKKLKEAEGN